MKIFSFNSLLYELHYLRGSGTRGYGSYLLFFDSLGLITLNTSLEKSYHNGGHVGSPQSGTDKKNFGSVFGKTPIAERTWMININLFLQNKFRIICRVFVTEIVRSVICAFPLQHPQISCNFGSFSNFLEKLETYLGTIF